MTQNYFISIEGKCKDCDYPIICQGGAVLEDKDYHLYCSNPLCKNHNGKAIYDQQFDEVEFLMKEKI